MPRTILLVPLLLSLTACVSPQAAAPTVAFQRDAINTLSLAYANDLALLRAQTNALLNIRRTSTLGSLHRELIEQGFITPTASADTQSFDAALSDPESTATLVLEVRTGRMTAEQAPRFLTDYALLTIHSDALRLQREALATLHPMRQLTDATAALNASLAAHEQDIAHLFSELTDSNTALSAYTTSTPFDSRLTAPDARTLWQHLITNAISDPARQAAVLQLLDDILAQ